ncbi:MAG: UxaA family hydrolase [Desulfovibrionaceae bacterium]|jgi:altronate dehydratase large subunit|nr:UxaA family hydrolase [Desulfovibrionaceae bacterium]
MKFKGFIRPDGSVGIRNHVLIMANARGASNLALLIARLVHGATVYVQPQEGGRDTADRQTIARTLIGAARNPNVGGVLVVGVKENGGYPEFDAANFVDAIAASGKPVETVFLNSSGGLQHALGEGMRKARALIQKASECEREEVGLGDLSVAVKCGYSDPTSGMSGNPVVGYLFDRIVEAGGTAMFSETTEVIGAEHILAKRFTDEGQRRKFLDAVARVEAQAKATGEDIRKINPIPANIQAGLTTLEEKSLGAIVKSGSMPIQGCVAYGEKPEGRGLYFMDAWMSSSALFLGFAAAGAVLTIFQVGGGRFPEDALMPSAQSGLVAPTLFMTGNPHAYENIHEEVDFTSGTVISEKEPLASAGDRLVREVLRCASGRLVKGEIMGVKEFPEMYLQGPCL